MKKHLSFSIATIMALSAPGIANAQLYITASTGGVPSVSGATLETFDEASPPILTFSGSAGLAMGHSAPGAFVAPPYFSGSTAAFFSESPTTGLDDTQYAAVWSGGKATFSFSSPQNYFGILWGSPDTDNNLTFYDGANNVIGTIFSTDIPGVNFTDPNRTFYVNVSSTIAFSSVVASSQNQFEFDDVAYAMVVPEPASLSLLAFGILGVGLLRRRK